MSAAAERFDAYRRGIDASVRSVSPWSEQRGPHGNQVAVAASPRQRRGTRGAARAVAGGGGAGPRLPRPAAAVRARHVGVVRRDDRRRVRAAGRQPRRRRHAQRADLDDQHRRLHVERARRRAARDHQPRRGRRAPARTTLAHARAHGAPPAERPVLQLVRPPHGREADGVAADRRAADADPLLGRQRLAGDRAADRRSAASPSWRARAGALFDSMDFGFYYRPAVNRIALPLRARAPASRPAATTRSSARAGSPSYIGIAKGEIPPKEYFGAWRTFPDTCDWSWQETRPVGFHRTYFGVDVFEGAYPYNGTRVVPGWGGSMFEALMPALFVPEEQWAPRSWGDQPPADGRGADPPRAGGGRYGYWGFSPSNMPEGGYDAYGVDAIGMDPGRLPLQRGPHARRPRLRRLPGPPGRSPTRRRRPTRTASSPRTPRSSRLRYAPEASAGATSPSSQHDFPASTASGASATA